MSKLSELVGVVEEPHLVIQEYFKTLDDWCTEMELSDPIKQSVMSSQLVLIPEGFRDCPKAFTNYASDFYNYCKHANSVSIEICCNDEEFTQLELCSVKVRLGKIIATSSISGVIIWNIVSGYIKDVIDEAVKTEPVVEQVADVPSFQSEPECSFSVIIRDSTGKCIEVKYDGPVSGMEEAGEQIKIIAGDGK